MAAYCTSGPVRSRKIPEIPMIADFIQRSEVRLRGWTFPHTDASNAANFSEGKQSHTVSRLGYVEGYRAYRNGLFVWRGALGEDTQGYRERKELRFPNVIYDVTEFVFFCKRYHENLEAETVSISLTLNKTQGRQLASTPDIDLGNYICHEPSISAEELIEAHDLAASYGALAKRFLEHLFALFNWNDPSEEMLQGWQQKLLEHRI